MTILFFYYSLTYFIHIELELEKYFFYVIRSIRGKNGILHSITNTEKLKKYMIKWDSIIMVIMFWDLLMFDQCFLSPQVKRSVIISNKHSIYKLPQELQNDLRIRILGNLEISVKPENLIELYWLYVLAMSRTRLRVNPHSIVAWMSRNSLLEAGAKSEV